MAAADSRPTAAPARRRSPSDGSRKLTREGVQFSPAPPTSGPPACTTHSHTRHAVSPQTRPRRMSPRQGQVPQPARQGGGRVPPSDGNGTSTVAPPSLVCPGTTRQHPAPPGITLGRRVHETASRGISPIENIRGDSRIFRTLNPRARRRRSTRSRHNSRAGAGLGRHCVTRIVQVTAILDLQRAPGPADQAHTGSIARICQVSQRSAGTGPTWSRSVMAIAATPPSARDLRPWARDGDPPACRMARLRGDFMPMPAHQDGRDACGEMRWPHLAPVMPGPASPSPSRMTVAAGKASGSVNRLLPPGSVRHMSVTTAAQRRPLTGDDTRRHKAQRPARRENPPVTGRFRW